MQRKKLSLPSLPIRTTTAAALAPVAVAVPTALSNNNTNTTTTTPQKQQQKKMFGTDVTNSTSKVNNNNSIGIGSTSYNKKNHHDTTSITTDEDVSSFCLVTPSPASKQAQQQLNNNPHNHNLRIPLPPTLSLERERNQQQHQHVSTEISLHNNNDNKSSTQKRDIILTNDCDETTENDSSTTTTTTSSTSTGSSSSSSSTSSSSSGETTTQRQEKTSSSPIRMQLQEKIQEKLREPISDILQQQQQQCDIIKSENKHDATPVTINENEEAVVDESMDTDNFELTEDFLSPPPPVGPPPPSSHSTKVDVVVPPSSVSSPVVVNKNLKLENEQEEVVQQTIQRKIPSSPQQQQNQTQTKPQRELSEEEQDELLHLRSQLRRVQLENDRLSEDSDFFRNAANNMKKQVVFAKQQLMSQIEFFAEPHSRELIENEFFSSFREHIESRFRIEVHHSDLIIDLTEEKDELKNQVSSLLMMNHLHHQEQQKNNCASPPATNKSVEMKKLESALFEANKEINNLQKSIKLMCKSWQQRYDSLRSERSAMENTLNESQSELVSLRNFAESHQNKNKKVFADASVDVNREQMLKDIERLEEMERERFVEKVEAEEFNFARLFEGVAKNVSQEYFECRASSEKKIDSLSSEVGKFKKRFEQVTAECERLVEENGKLHKELIALRQELYN